MARFRLRKSVLAKRLNYLLASLTLWSFLNAKVLVRAITEVQI